jgi:hypothetical protein
MAIAEILDRLQVQHEVTGPNANPPDPIALDSDAFVAESPRQRAQGRKHPFKTAGLREEYTRTIEPARLLAAEAPQSEYGLHDLVHAAYGLAPGEVRLMWDTAPPRMPVPRPVSF